MDEQANRLNTNSELEHTIGSCDTPVSTPDLAGNFPGRSGFKQESGDKTSLRSERVNKTTETVKGTV